MNARLLARDDDLLPDCSVGCGPRLLMPEVCGEQGELAALWKKCTAIGRNSLLSLKRFLMEPKPFEELTAFDELVKRKLEERKIVIAHVSRFSIAILMMLALLLSLFTILSGTIARFSDGQIICLLCSMALSICAYSAPPSTPRLSEVYYACMMILCTAYFLTSPLDLFMLSLHSSWFIRFVLSVTLLNTVHMIGWNLAVLGATCVCTVTLPGHHPSSDLLLSFDIMATLAVIVTSIGFEQWIISAIERETWISKLKNNNFSSMLLLDMMCDVVLELSEKLIIESDSRNFAAMMLKSSALSLKGQPFACFIEDELGRRAFEKQLVAGAGQNSKVGVCNTTLTDSLRNRIEVEIFFVKVEMDMDIYHYLIGVKESNQDPCGVAPSFSSPTVPRCIPSKQNGTPSTSSQSHLRQTCCPPRPRGKGGLRNPQLMLTGNNARCASLEECLSTWNINIPRGVCCSYHAYLIACKQMVAKLARSPCDRTFPTFSAEGVQCQTCGIIVGEAEEGEHDTCPTCDSLTLRAFSLHGTDNIDAETCAEGSE
eukprot:TRINITY_DN13924_c0_g1_i4.p1 TRINITY_DN13924_c0_g1~~TRINITY_DN13924_c0_g1_i4.p1  ORF type:complete len:541 (+),score=57.76 TRINITY_DN13924_c0_g1_i4:71-1693(+)